MNEKDTSLLKTREHWILAKEFYSFILEDLDQCLKESEMVAASKLCPKGIYELLEDLDTCKTMLDKHKNVINDSILFPILESLESAKVSNEEKESYIKKSYSIIRTVKSISKNELKTYEIDLNNLFMYNLDDDITSLSVDEQFEIFYPYIMISVHSKRKQFTFKINTKSKKSNVTIAYKVVDYIDGCEKYKKLFVIE